MEHLIRLRGAWEWWDPAALGNKPRRVNLPVLWPTGMPQPFRLRRRFGAPPFDPAKEDLVLRFEDVPGLRSAWLNGRLLVGLESQRDLTQVSLVGLVERRNELELEVDPGGWAEAGPEAVPWGSVALVIKTAGG
jgi:hypothetical protein